MKLLGNILKIIFTVTMIIALTLAGIVGYVIRSPMPQVAGSLRAAGLQNEVTVHRDEYGIPHIYAASSHDLFFAQGYVHAQDRFWQMEFWRRLGAGRLSEILGKGSLGVDRFARTLGWARAAAADEAVLDPETKQALQWYADGVNAYIDSTDNLGLEFTLLGVQGANVEPEKWTVQNTLTWLKVMSWDLGGNMNAEIRRAMLISLLGPDAMFEMMPTYPDDHPIITPNPAFGLAGSDVLADAEALSELTLGFSDGDHSIGSNNWVVSGKLTDTGKPYLANDPHLGIQMPSIWYEIGLHCVNIIDICPYDVAGFSFAGAPGVIIGHNQRIAWGTTNLGPDVQDIFIERINPENQNQYEVNGAWADAQVIPERILVRGKVEPDPEHPEQQISYDEGTDISVVAINVRVTRHGPIIDDVDTAADALGESVNGAPVPTPGALALRWTAIAEPSLTYRAVLGINRAQNWDEFRNALRDWSVPSQNFVYADVDGNIGYQAPGLIPVRRSGDGFLPVPGWNDDSEWVGYIPFDQLPSSFNPPQGFIATANNAIVGSEYPYVISFDWDKGYRAQRIVEMITAKPKLTLDDIKGIQGDNANLSAKEVMPYLTALGFEEDKYRNGLEFLKSWDYQQHMDSGPAALYNLFWARLISNTFFDELGDKVGLRPGPGDVTMLAVRNLLSQPNNHWWDNVDTTDKVETRDDILSMSFHDAYRDAESLMGNDSGRWTWGQLHTATFRNQSLGRSGVGLVEALFNRGPAPASGGSANVNNTGYRFVRNDDNSLNVAQTFVVTSVPSMRMIIDLSNLANSQTMHTTGQSGHPFNSHYNDMIDPWRNIEYHAMLWGRGAVEDAAKATLTLK